MKIKISRYLVCFFPLLFPLPPSHIFSPHTYSLGKFSFSSVREEGDDFPVRSCISEKHERLLAVCYF